MMASPVSLSAYSVSLEGDFEELLPSNNLLAVCSVAARIQSERR